MLPPRFHVDPLQPGMNTLSADERVHAVRSRRLAEGDPVVLTDGRGHEAAGRIARASRDEVLVEAEPIVYRERPRPRLTLACALPKGPRQDTLVEKCTELGVAALWPVATQRSIVTPKEHKIDKWRRRAIEAIKQSGQCWIPELAAMRDLAEVLEESQPVTERWVATTPGDDPQPEPQTARSLLDRWANAERLLIFIGPEGGWTPDELRLFDQSGVHPLTLGPNTLRIETAAIAAAALVHAIMK